MAADNGTTKYDKVESGTIMGLLDDGRVRPMGKTLADGAGGGSTAVITVDDPTGFFVGDAVFVDGSDTGETVDSISGSDITLTGNATWSDDSVIAVGDEAGSASAASALGILVEDTATYDAVVDQDGDAIHTDRPCLVMIRGVVDESGLENSSIPSAVKSDLDGITFV
jgi:hypothetical protein